MVKTKIKQLLGRFGFLMLRDGSLEIQGSRRPELGSEMVQGMLGDLERGIELPMFDKPDYFASFPFVESLVSAEEFRKKGLQIACLHSRMLYPLPGVYMPTQQDYLNLFSNYVEQMSARYKEMQTMVDLGTGSGILPIIMKESAGFTGKMVGIDCLGNAIESAKMNLSLFGVTQSQF